MANEGMGEREFHDAWALSVDPHEVDVDGMLSREASPEFEWLLRNFGNLEGKSVLELGCGLGEASINLARLGAEVTATDLSSEMLNLTLKVAELNHVSIKTVVASAMDLSEFDDGTFDVVYGGNVLHHVDIATCLSEVNRVLKPGGLAGFWDPVQYNPVINVYRRMASDVRTIDEHPIRRKDIALMKACFQSTTVNFSWLLATSIFLKFFLLDRIAPSEGRYWKLVVRRRHEYETYLRVMHRLDRFLLRLVPPLKWWCWNVAVILRKD